MRYVPNEAEGVLRTGLQGNPATGPSINPDPAKLNSLIQQRKAGASEVDILIQLLTSPAYLVEGRLQPGDLPEAGRPRLTVPRPGPARRRPGRGVPSTPREAPR